MKRIFVLFGIAALLSVSNNAYAGEGGDEPDLPVVLPPQDAVTPTLQGVFGDTEEVPTGLLPDAGIYYQGVDPEIFLGEFDFRKGRFLREGEWPSQPTFGDGSWSDGPGTIVYVLGPGGNNERERQRREWLQEMLLQVDDLPGDQHSFIIEGSEDPILRPGSFDFQSANPSRRDGPIVGTQTTDVVIDQNGNFHLINAGTGANRAFLDANPPDPAAEQSGLEPGASAIVEIYLDCPVFVPGPNTTAFVLPGGQAGRCATVVSIQQTPVSEPIFADGFESGDTSAWSSFQNDR